MIFLFNDMFFLVFKCFFLFGVPGLPLVFTSLFCSDVYGNKCEHMALKHIGNT